MKKQRLISYILAGFIVTGFVYGVFIYSPDKSTGSKDHLATMEEGIVETDQSSQEQEDSPADLEKAKSLEKEIGELLESLSNFIGGIPAQLLKEIELIKVQFQGLKEQVKSLIQPSQSIYPVDEYSDLRPKIEPVQKTITVVSSEREETEVTLLSLSNLDGRSFQLQEVFFNSQDNPQFYNLSVLGKSDEEPIFSTGVSHYWIGTMDVDSAQDLTVSVTLQKCKPQLNNCDWTELDINVNLSDWILWDVSADKLVKLTGKYTITLANSKTD